MLRPNVLASLKNKVKDAASTLVPLPERFVLGYWPNVPNGIGYKLGTATPLKLIDIPMQYNVIAVAFMRGAGIPTFSPDRWSPQTFRSQIGVLNAQGRPVLLTLGGADAHIELTSGQEEGLAYEIIRLVETYGFDGIDIDLKQAAILAGNNATVIPDALKLVKDHYRSEGGNFIISMSPEYTYLRQGGNYAAYLQQLEGYYDIVAVQYYNQGGDGFWVDEISDWVTQSDDAQKENFLYFLTDSITHGTRGFIQIPADKLAIGLPANRDAAGSGYVIDSDAVYNALAHLDAESSSVRGLAVWSIDWDDGIDANGAPYDWEFIKRYGRTINGSYESDVGTTKPSTPTHLTSTTQTETTITLKWNASTGNHPVSSYTIFRNGVDIGTTGSLVYTDTGLTAGSQYAYRVVAVDSAGVSSDSSTTLCVSTLRPAVTARAWAEDTAYKEGDVVSYGGKTWRCIMQHTSNQYWTPDVAYSLWEAAW